MVVSEAMANGSLFSLISLSLSLSFVDFAVTVEIGDREGLKVGGDEKVRGRAGVGRGE